MKQKMHIAYDMIQGTKTSQSKDPLIVEEGPMTRSQANRVKDAMRLLAQVAVDEKLIMASKESSFMFGLKEETR